MYPAQTHHTYTHTHTHAYEYQLAVGVNCAWPQGENNIAQKTPQSVFSLSAASIEPKLSYRIAAIEHKAPHVFMQK